MTAKEEDPHRHHNHRVKQSGYKRSVHKHEIPQLYLVDMDNNKVSLPDALGDEGPVMLNFNLSTRCNTIYAVLSAALSSAT